LIKLHVRTEVSKVYTSSYATGLYLKESNLKKVFLIGTESFAQELASLNIEVVDEYSCEAVVVGLDTNFTYNTIAQGLTAICNGAKIIASNADANFPIENGVYKPATNAILASLLGASNRQVDYIVGKPNTYLLETICKEWNLHKDNICVIGDMLESDIAMANRYGCKSILVGRDGKTLEDAIKIILGDCQ
jgi:HAD superfamily hydrolase (TIGR01450 family)